MIVSGHSGNTVASVETVKALPKQRSFMLSWTRFVLVLVALEGAHACRYLNPPDSLACSSELEPLIRRDSMDVRTATIFRRRIDQTSNSNLTSLGYGGLVN